MWGTAIFVCAYLFLSAQAAFGLNITATQVALGTTIPGSSLQSSAAPGTATGGGNLAAIFGAAANYWEQSIFDNFNLLISYAWAPLGPGVAATEITTSTGFDGAGVYRNLNASIIFSTTGLNWFLDATPTDNSEYASYFKSANPLGTAQSINTGVRYSNPTTIPAGNLDLLMAAAHEIGHALGLDDAYAGYIDQLQGSNIIVSSLTSSLYQGATIPTFGRSSAHINPASSNLGDSLMQTSLGSGIRILPSTADILVVCQSSSFTQCNNGPSGNEVPEPGTVSLFFSGLALIFLRSSSIAGKEMGSKNRLTCLVRRIRR